MMQLPLVKRYVCLCEYGDFLNVIKQAHDLFFSQVEMAYSLLGDIIPEKNGLGLAVAGAFVTILSRSFFDDTQPVDKEKLIPLLDMLQHDYNPNIQYCDNDGHIEVRAAVDMEANTELLNCYNYILSPWNLFTRYGFVPGRYESPRELLVNKDPIFFGSD